MWAGMYHDVCGTLNGRQLADGSLLYGCTCNMSLSTAVLAGLSFDTSFPNAAFEVGHVFCYRSTVATGTRRDAMHVFCCAAQTSRSSRRGLLSL